jgi:ribosomal protein L18E
MMVLEKTQFSNCLIKLDKEKQVEVKLDILEKIEKPKNDAYKVALEKANRIAKEAEEARIRAEELKTED